jgi:hypothetical protein
MGKAIKRITLAGTRMYNYDDSVARAFTDLGIEVDNIHYKRVPTLIENLSGLKYFVDRFNSYSKKEYLEKIRASVLKTDLLVFFGRNKLLNFNDIIQLKRGCDYKIVFWLIDSIYSTPGWQELLRAVDLVICYNKEEVEILLARSINSIFLPLAYDPSFYFPERPVEKDIDVYFVGSLSPRISFLDQVAKKLGEQNISFHIDGRLGFLRRLGFLFRRQNNYFRRCASFKSRTHEQINKYSNRAKICLNIQPKQATSALNIRTYEILGTGSFQLTNSTPVLERFFRDQHSLVVYTDVGDLIEKINYYLSESKKREQIALKGHELAANCHLFRYRVEEILKHLE